MFLSACHNKLRPEEDADTRGEIKTMQWTGLNELRDKYLTFFEGKGHLRLDSFPLVPKNDPSLLLINSGMAPM